MSFWNAGKGTQTPKAALADPNGSGTPSQELLLHQSGCFTGETTWPFTAWERPALRDNPRVSSPALLGLGWSSKGSGVSSAPILSCYPVFAGEAINQQVLKIALFVMRNDIRFCVARRCIKFKGIENNTGYYCHWTYIGGDTKKSSKIRHRVVSSCRKQQPFFKSQLLWVMWNDPPSCTHLALTACTQESRWNAERSMQVK